MNLHFDALIKTWDTLMLVSAFVIAPEMIKKWLAMRYNGNPK